jgi:hypothetical protein
MASTTNIPTNQAIITQANTNNSIPSSLRDMKPPTINAGLYSDLNNVYATTINRRNDLEVYTINALDSVNNYRNFLKYPISREELPVYIRKIYQNTYNYEKYKNQIHLLYIINIYCILFIGFTLLNNNFLFFDDLAYSSIIGILLAFLFGYIMYNMWDIYLRSNTVYDMYDFDKFSEPPNRVNPENYDLNITTTSEDDCPA